MSCGVRSSVGRLSREVACAGAELGAAFFEMPAPSCVVVPAVPEVEATGEANVELAAVAILQGVRFLELLYAVD